ncbi:sensor histidine kinase [Sphingobacterium thalpophilum]|uniref:Histidine kinase n=1 Tax=Sphingobacterium thalpophilum TaxID=259 RepID=A0A4U9W8N2_9SPHI|nr:MULTISPECIES: histidine kinase [Sphingobacterium]MCW8313934.1 histidine kinase [Sphingobacterium sp. InxBP1]VTR55244.1 Inner membrane protein ypdA [Sphingobacterium thalpophilum]
MQDLSCSDVFLKFFTEHKFRTLRHVLFLIGLFLLFANANTKSHFQGEYNLYFTIFLWVVFVCMFYTNMYVLLPRFFFREKYEVYILALILLVASSLALVRGIADYIYIVHTPAIKRPESDSMGMGMVAALFIVIPIILTTTTFKLFKRWIEDNKRISDLKNLALTTELISLKNQIQPHFLFNMLNNVKALIRKDPNMATEVIIKLSDFLRYQLYENNDDRTLLKSEIGFISNFLKLEEIRRDKLSTSIVCMGALQKKSVFLPPHLFTAFVENAIKYSLSANDDPTFIDIRFAEAGGRLYFECENSQDPDQQAAKSKYGGLGLANAKRRLDLLYKDDYQLTVSKSETRYKVKLDIPL